MSTLTDDIEIDLVGATLEVSISPDTLSANGLTTSTVSARFLETTSRRYLADYGIAFSAKLGSITGTATTELDGVASVTYTAPAATGTDTIIATRGGIADTTVIELVASNSSAIALAAGTDTLAVLGTGGTELSIITATVWDDYSQLVPAGIAVQMVASTGTFSNGTATITRLTSSNGQVSFTYQSGTTPGTVSFTATSGTATGSAPLLIITPGPAANIVIGSDPLGATDLGNGLARTKLGAFITDAYSNPVMSGTVIHFSLSGANADTADITTLVVTDATGVAEVFITYPTDAAGLTVTVDVSSGTVTESKDIILP